MRSNTRMLHILIIDFHLYHLWKFIRLSAPIMKCISNFLSSFIYLIRSIVLLDFIFSSKNFTLIKLFLPTIFFANRVLLLKFNLLSCLKGFFFVIAQIIFFNSNLFFASLDISRCPLCAGSNVPPKIPILIFLGFYLFSGFTIANNFIFIRNQLS